jgi:hypothetical protein
MKKGFVLDGTKGRFADTACEFTIRFFRFFFMVSVHRHSLEKGKMLKDFDENDITECVDQALFEMHAFLSTALSSLSSALVDSNVNTFREFLKEMEGIENIPQEVLTYDKVFLYLLCPDYAVKGVPPDVNIEPLNEDKGGEHERDQRNRKVH